MRLAWPPWKLWSRVPAPARRRIQFGIDYGTCVSKIVFRANGAPPNERAVLVPRNGTFRIPSRVCATATTLFFGDVTRTRAECHIYQNTKARIATEAVAAPERAGDAPAPLGFSAADLAALTFSSAPRRCCSFERRHRTRGDWRVGRCADADLQRRAATSAFPKCCTASVGTLQQRGFTRFGVLDRRRASPAATTSRALPGDPRPCVSRVGRESRATHSPIDIIRPEDEAGLWWLLRSPSVGAGP